MATEQFQKGKFYTLPLSDIRNEGNNSFFIVEANGREYAIKMFDFQRNDPSLHGMNTLPCMVKDVHGDSIVFVQNFAQMFGDRYSDGQLYPFVVMRTAYNPDTRHRYYDIRDDYGVPFRLKCSRNTILVPNQKIRCSVSRPAPNKLTIELEDAACPVETHSISPADLLATIGVDPSLRRYVLGSFARNAGFDEARQYCDDGDALWVVKAVMAVSGVEKWPAMTNRSKRRLLDCYRRVCMYLLEDTDYLLQFGESERGNYQEWIADRVSMTDIYTQCIELAERGKTGDEVDAILGKIKNSGYIYHPHRRMRLLIAIFSMQPQLLDERIDDILNIVGDCAKNWKQTSFTDAFSNFLCFYVESNREKANSLAVVDGAQGRVMLNRMVRSLCFLLLMTGGNDANGQLYKSMLLHYLSFVRQGKTLDRGDMKKDIAQKLVERAFNALLLPDDGTLDISWGHDFGNYDMFAYRMAKTPCKNTTFPTRSYEACNVRFTVSAEGITLSRSHSCAKERNVLPAGLMDWHNVQIFLSASGKYGISRQTKSISQWKVFWNDVEQALFEPPVVKTSLQCVKLVPEVGTVTYVRVLYKDEESPCRYYCRIEDNEYEGEGWLDTYLKGGSTGMFHYDPRLDIGSFCDEAGRPMIIKVRVNSVVDAERQTYMFDCMQFVDEFIKGEVEYGEKSNCLLLHFDRNNNVYLGVTSFGYSIFLPVGFGGAHYDVGTAVRVRETDCSRPNAIQGEIIGNAEGYVDIKASAEDVLAGYWQSTGSKVYEESEEELEEEAMAISEEQFPQNYMTEIVSLLDHKAVLSADNVAAYAFLAVAHIVARMTGDEPTAEYLAQREEFLCVLDDYATNGSINDARLESLGGGNGDMLDRYPILRQRLTEMRIVNCLGRPEKNAFLWGVCNEYDRDHILSKLARLMLSYNMAEGFVLYDFQKAVVDKIKGLLNVNVELPTVYSFGEESQLTEFKSSIVFPPENRMRADKIQQTFNVMKVLCGMVNSYGGTLYLGVHDETGTAKGLAEDLAYFDGSTDKFDNYVRSNIRVALGDRVNAAVTITRPEAGKHFVYAINVVPSRHPVVLKLDNHYYLREGSSTYPVELRELQTIMGERDFSAYGIAAPDAGSGNAASGEPVAAAPVVMASQAASGEPATVRIATSRTRSNVIEAWDDDYLVDTCCFVRLVEGGWCVLDGVDYADGLLTLAVHNDEADGSLVLAYADGRVNKVPMSQIVDKARGTVNKMYSDEKPVFVSPAKKDAALLTAYEDDRGKVCLRLDDLHAMPDGKMLSVGQTLVDVDFKRMVLCDVVDRKYIANLKRLHNLKRSSLGQSVLSGSMKTELELLSGTLGINI